MLLNLFNVRKYKYFKDFVFEALIAANSVIRHITSQNPVKVKRFLAEHPQSAHAFKVQEWN